MTKNKEVFKLSYFDATATTAATTTTVATTKPLQALTKNKLRDYVGSSLRERHSNQIATLKISLSLHISTHFSLPLSHSLSTSLPLFLSLSFPLYLSRLITVFGWAKWSYHVSLINSLRLNFNSNYFLLIVRGEI